ncbi:hypothetical protein pipiens_000793, partial [Culex pipiens pipiens]
MFARIWIISCTLITLMLATKTGAARPSPKSIKQPIRIRKFDCPGQPYPATKVIMCRVRNLRDQPQQVDFVVEILEPQVDILVAFELFVQHQHSRTLLYGTTMDYCRIMAGSDGNKVTELLFTIARKTIPQVLRTCPYGGVLNASEVSLGLDMVPAFTLPGRYRANMRWYNKKNQTMLAWSSEFELN